MVEDVVFNIILYVDDLLYKGVLGLIKDCNRNLEEEFEIKDLGFINYFLYIEL